MIIQPFIILPFQRPLAAFTLYRLFLKIRTSFLPSFYLSAPAALQPRDGPAKKFFARQHRPNRQVGTRVLGAKTHCSEKRCVTLPLLSAACPWRVPKRISHILRFPRLGCNVTLLLYPIFRQFSTALPEQFAETRKIPHICPAFPVLLPDMPISPCCQSRLRPAG